jgi:hypothetical protein
MLPKAEAKLCHGFVFCVELKLSWCLNLLIIMSCVETMIARRSSVFAVCTKRGVDQNLNQMLRQIATLNVHL